MVYVIQAQFGESNFYKVGFTRESVERRLKEIQAGCPVELKIVQVFEGGEKEEARYHGYLNSLRVRGEWFRDAPLIQEFIYGSKNGLIKYPWKLSRNTRYMEKHLFISRCKRVN